MNGVILKNIPDSKTPLAEALLYYVKTVSSAKRGCEQEKYRIKPLAEHLGHYSLSEISMKHVSKYRDIRLSATHPRNPEKTLSGCTVKLEMMLLSHLFTVAKSEWGIDLENPVICVRKPKAGPGRSRRLLKGEEKKILNAALKNLNKGMYAIIVLALETGMRQGEILNLKWENFSLKKRTIHLEITKNGDSRDIPLSIVAFNIFTNYLTWEKSGQIFTYTSQGFKSSWRQLLRSVNIYDLHFHDLRHEAISRLFEKGLDAIEVSTISGHRSMSMLKRYAHLQAYKLVAKLDPQKKVKHRTPQVKEFLVSYPALITQYSRNVKIEFYDFVDISLSGKNTEAVVEQAQSKLLRRIVSSLAKNELPPVPSNIDEILLPSKKTSIVNILPL